MNNDNKKLLLLPLVWLHKAKETVIGFARKVKRWVHARKVKRWVQWYIIRSPAHLWDKRLTGILKDVPEKKRTIYSTVLTNQYNYMKEAEQFYGIDAVNLAKDILDKLTILDIIGCQPISNPVDYCYSLVMNCDDDDNMRLEINKTVVEAKTKRFNAKILFTLMEDLRDLHGVDPVPTLTDVLGHELAKEITTEQLQNLRGIATKTLYKNYTPAQAILLINKTCNDIAVATKRGAGNSVIMTIKAWERLVDYVKSTPSLAFVEEPFDGNDTGLIYLGTMMQGVKLYVDTTEVDNDNVLVGYKGTSQIDMGYAYVPYVMVLSGGIVSDKDTFEPSMTLMTRNGTLVVDNASDYYREISF